MLLLNNEQLGTLKNRMTDETMFKMQLIGITKLVIQEKLVEQMLKLMLHTILVLHVQQLKTVQLIKVML